MTSLNQRRPDLISVDHEIDVSVSIVDYFTPNLVCQECLERNSPSQKCKITS